MRVVCKYMTIVEVSMRCQFDLRDSFAEVLTANKYLGPVSISEKTSFRKIS